MAEVAPYLEQARFGIMADRIGGGFKLKMLDYIFAGLPLAAIEDQVAGLPLVAGTDMIAADTVERLCARVIAAIDDIGLLDRMRKSALARCSGRFDWSDRGRDLLHVIAHLAADGRRRRECLTHGI